MVIATARSARQATSIAKKLEAGLRAAGARQIQIEGLAQGDWVLVDAGDIIVHIFRPEVREFYRIEDIWSMDLPSTENMAYLSA